MQYSTGQAFALAALRLTVGWHFLYEGLVKLLTPSWSGRSYLLDSQGPLTGFYHWIANNDIILRVADTMNIWGLTLVGLALVLGVFNRIATLAGIVLLLLYYFSHPAWFGLEYMFPSEGSYFLVNKNIVEVMALVVLFFFPSGDILGLQKLFLKK